MLSILHISDLHFGPYHMRAIADRLLQQAHELAPSAIVASGDFTQRAKVAEYEQAREFLDELPAVPLVTTPGNHDVPLYRVWERLTRPHANYREHIADELDMVVELPGAMIVSLNSSAPYRAITNGRLRRRQLDFAQQAFAAADDDALRVFVAHHHLAPPPDYQRQRPIPGAKRAIDRLERMGVEIVLGGHLHRAFIGNSLDLYAGPDREHGIIVAQCGTTTSRRGRAREHEKNSFNMIYATSDTIVITHWMYFSATDAFAPISRHSFPRRPRLHLADSVGADSAGNDA
jgi:3',5'-cyclic AMP phosphodiesterase CpdA